MVKGMKPTLLCALFTLLVSALTCPAETPKSAAPVSVSDARRAAIVSFCQKNRGRKVGNGECWTLANEAFKTTGAQRPKGQLRVWGRRLDLKRESPLPGDILECDRTRFADGSYVLAQHTAVIVGVQSATLVRIAEQNFAGKKKVLMRDLELSGLRGGSIAVYRPQ
jgi:hypothetical protein